MGPARSSQITLLLLLGLGGCDNLFNLQKVGGISGDAGTMSDDGVMSDAFVPVHCSNSAFPTANPTAVPELRGIVGGDPFMTEDRLELFFVKTGPSPYEIWHASRTTPDGIFAVDVDREPFNVPGVANIDPSITLDGEHLVFVSTTANGQRAFFTERSLAAWKAPVELPGLESATVLSAQISWDGLVIYYIDASNDLLRADRRDRGAPFGNSVVVRAAVTNFPSVSADELELFSTGSGIEYVARTSTMVQFGGLGVVLPFGNDPDLLRGSTTLVIAYDTSIAVLERLCN